MKKRILSLLLVLLMVMTLVPTEVFAISPDDSSVLLKQNTDYTCTLCSAAMMLRRRAVIDGSSNWSSITENSIRSTAWDENAGLYWQFTYAGMSVGHYQISGSYQSKKDSMISLLSKHPEGIMIYDRDIPHAVLLTSYNSSSDTFYCADPAGGYPSGIIQLASSLLGRNGASQSTVISNIDDYWMITNRSGGSSGSETPSVSVKERVTHGYSVKISANYLLKNYTSELDTNAESKNYVLKKDKAYSLSCSEKVVLSNGTVRYKWVSGDTPPKTLWFEYDSSVMSVSLRHQYSEYNYEAEHPHKYYRKCACGDFYYTGETEKLASCPECHPTSVKERVTHGYSVKISANYLLKNYTSELDTNAESKNYVLKKDKAYSLSCSEKVVLSNGTVRYKWVSGDTPPKTLWFEYDSSVMSVSLRHQYTEYYYEAAHPHKYYKKCACGEFYYTGETEKLASCPECNPTGPVTYAVTGGNITFDKATGTITDCDDTVTEANIPSKIAGVAVTSIGDRAFEDCINIKRIEIPDSVTNIGEYAFLYCYNLISITLPNKLISISDGLLARCESLTSVTIPSSVTSIGKEIFYSCEKLTSITIPNGVTSINDNAFRFCRSLTSVTIPNSVTIIADCAFEGCSRLSNIKIPDSVTSIGNHAFDACSSLSSINIPDSVTSIGYTAFADCDSLTNVILPNSVTNISTSLFAGCTGLKSITIPNSVMSVEINAFGGCTGLTSITIPSNVTSIGKRAFKNCTSLTKVTIPSSVNSIGADTFSGCKSITDIYYSGSETQWNRIVINDGNDPLLNAKIHYNSVDSITPVDPMTPSGFTDVPSDAFYANAVKWAVEKEITTGVGGNRFDPNGQCTRGQVVTFLWRAAGKPIVSTNVSFSDVQPGAFYYEAVKWAVANGITQGIGGNRFAPNDTCTRGQVVTFLHRAENSPAASTISSFTDVPATAFYYNAVNWAVANGITNGTGNGRFSPNDTCTRAQVVTFLYRAQ